MAGSRENGAPVDHRRAAVHAEPDAFDDGGQMPRVDRPPVGRGLPADGLEPDTPEPSGPKRVPGE
jgi:hypothetical protein